MTTTGRYHGGLVFYGYAENPLDQFSRIVSATLEDYGHPVERQTIQGGKSAVVLTSQYKVNLELEDLGNMNCGQAVPSYEDQIQRIAIEFTPVLPGREDRDITELMMVVLLYRMVDICDAEQVEWMDPDTALPIDEFLGAFSHISPRRVRGRQEILDQHGQRFADVDETAPDLMEHYDTILGQVPHSGEVGLIDLTQEETLALAFRVGPHPTELSPDQEEAASDIRRLATWGMTGMVVFLSAPVAVSLAAVNLVRGEDFRLNTHVLSLTGLLVMLQSSGALASVVNYLP
ncbi:hypothetical protein K3727_09100 [Rhodobacteraceae bacterium M382]|nr:hypothetical protein K3727_09100 [Rhodobacteraceae bacterium M382]